MKQKVLVILATLIVALATVSTVICINLKKTNIFEANVDALARMEGGYACPGACLTWTGSTGGGLDCLCDRYTGRCKTWCSK